MFVKVDEGWRETRGNSGNSATKTSAGYPEGRKLITIYSTEMSKNWEDDDELTPDELENDEELDEEPIDDSSAAPSENTRNCLVKTARSTSCPECSRTGSWTILHTSYSSVPFRISSMD